MKYDVAIICSENDFYLGDLICQELEARGKRCRFNLRDAKTPTDLGTGWFMTDYPLYIAVVNREFIETLKFNKLTEAKTGFDCQNAILFLNEDGVELPSRWKYYVSVDANAGWEEEFMDAIANGGSLNGLYTPYGEVAQPTNGGISQPSIPQTSASGQGPAMFTPDGYPTAANLRAQVYGTAPGNETASGNGVAAGNETAPGQMDGPEDSNESLTLSMASHMFDHIEDILLPDPPASITLRRALKYLLGDGVVKDTLRAASLVKRALDENPEDGEVLYYLGAFTERGLAGVAGNEPDEEAVRLYTRSMEKGFAPAMYRLGVAASNIDTPEMDKKALDVLMKCRQEGDFRASYWIGRMAEMEHDFENAFEYYSEAAEEGYAPAQNELGNMYYLGKAITPNADIALEWYRLAAAQGLPAGMANLAEVLLMNEGITEEVVKLVEQAAQAGESNAYLLEQEIERLRRQQQQEENRRIEAQRRAEEEERRAQQRADDIKRLVNTTGNLLGELFFRR